MRSQARKKILLQLLQEGQLRRFNFREMGMEGES